MESRTKLLRALLKEKFFNSCLVHEEDRKNEENSFCMKCCFSLCVHCMPHHQSHKILQVRRYMYNDVLRLKDAQKIFDCSLIQGYICFHSSVRVDDFWLRGSLIEDLFHLYLRGSKLYQLNCRGTLFQYVTADDALSYNHSLLRQPRAITVTPTSYTTNNEKVVLLRPRQHVSSQVRGSRFMCLVCNQNIKPSFGYCSMSCKLSNETTSGGGQRVYAGSSSGGLGRSFLGSGSVSECLVSDESSVEESSMKCESKSVKQEMSATTSNKGFTFTRKLHGRKCVPQRSPFF